MNISKLKLTKSIATTILLCGALAACSGGSSSSEKVQPPPPPPPPKTITPDRCGKSAIDETQSCLIIDDRAAITYAPASQTQYAGVAIFLHGAPGEPTKVSGIFDAKVIAEKFNLVSIAPEGNGSIYEWNSSNNGLEAITPDVDYLVSVIDDIQTQYSFTDEKVYIFGYSAGGFMAYKLACRIPDRLTAVISLAGQYRGNLDNCSTSSPVAIHHMHSPSDQDVPFSGRANGNIASVTDTIAFWQQKNGCGAEKELLVQDGVTAASPKTDTEIYQGCVKSIGLSKLNLVAHEDDYIAEKLLATYEYLLTD
jgi:polyhydroxybutyrate depolymerase